MDNRILINLDWQQRIRDKMGVDDAYLPDSVISQPDVITLAEANIIAQIPEYPTLNGDPKVYLEYTVVLECCIILCDGMPARLPNKETGPHASYELGIDWAKKKTDLKEERETCIMKILDLVFPKNIPSSPSYFSVTFPTKEW